MSPLQTINILGHAYFITSKVVGAKEIFVFDNFCRIIIDNLNFYRKSKQFKLLGYVIMLDHIHLIIWPIGKFTMSDIMMNFKEYTSKQIIAILKRCVVHTREALAPRPELTDKMSSGRRGRLPFSRGLRGRIHNGAGLETSPSQLLAYFREKATNSKNQNYKVWQSRNWIENIYSVKFLQQKLDYIHANPLRAGFVHDPIDWQYSSARNYFLGDNSIIKIDRVDL